MAAASLRLPSGCPAWEWITVQFPNVRSDTGMVGADVDNLENGRQKTIQLPLENVTINKWSSQTANQVTKQTNEKRTDG